jgi:hypothetical protein
MEPYRTHACTVDPAAADETDLALYMVSVKDSEDFGRLWSALLRLMDRGSHVTLRGIGFRREFFCDVERGYQPVVRITAPPVSRVRGYPPMIDDAGQRIPSERVELWRRFQRNEPLSNTELSLLDLDSVDATPWRLDEEAMSVNNGRWVMAGPPWPDDIRGEAGELPDVVHYEDRDGRLRWVAGPFPKTSIAIKCRIDIELVVDGEIVDLDRVEVPEYLVIDDQRPGANRSKPAR